MVRYLQASDLHGVDRVKAVIDTANTRDDVDAVFLLGDLVDFEYESGDYEYGRVQKSIMDEIQEADNQLAERLVAGNGITREQLLVHSKIRGLGGIDALRGVIDQVPDERQRAQLELMSDLYEESAAQMAMLDERYDALQDDEEFRQGSIRVQEMLESMPVTLSERIRELQDRDAAALDELFATTSHDVYVGDGNHDGQALRNLENAVNMGFLNEVLEIGGVRFAYEANTREAIQGSQELDWFYDGLDSIDPSRDLKTADLERVAGEYAEAHGENADLEGFLSEYLANNPVYNRLDAMGDIDVLFCHNPVGQQNATMRGQKQLFIDYSFALGQIMRKKKPSIHGYGHLHGKKGRYNRTDNTFGYEFESVHSTNNRFYVIDVDESTKKINWIDVYEIIDPQSN